MTFNNVAYVAGALICVLSTPAVPQTSKDWIDIKDPKELRVLYSNKTFRSTYAGVTVVEHYRADGKGLLVSGQQRTPRTWEVKGSEVCTNDASGTFCHRFQRSKKNPDEYVYRREPGNYLAVIKVEDGIPQF